MHIKVFGDSGRLAQLNDSTVALQARAQKMTIWSHFWFATFLVVATGLIVIVFSNKEPFASFSLISIFLCVMALFCVTYLVLYRFLSKDYGAISAIDVVEHVLSINADDRVTREIADNQIRNAVIELLYRERGSGFRSRSADRQRVKARTLHRVFFELKVVDKEYADYFQLAKSV